MDAYSRRILAIYLTFDPPSYRSCMMALRICVARFGRLPQTLVVDGGKEFHSVYFDTLLARYSCVKKTRPGGKPRFGSVIERLFGTTNTEFIYNLLGNTQATKQVRQRTLEVDPKRLAVWTLGDLYVFLKKWADQVYDSRLHETLGATPCQSRPRVNAGDTRTRRIRSRTSVRPFWRGQNNNDSANYPTAQQNSQQEECQQVYYRFCR